VAEYGGNHDVETFWERNIAGGKELQDELNETAGGGRGGGWGTRASRSERRRQRGSGQRCGAERMIAVEGERCPISNE